MALSAQSYLQQLQAILLRGKAWARDAGSVMTQFLTGVAQEFSRVDFRVDDVMNEADPRTCNELLTDWERVAGLPDPCGEELGNTAEIRRQVLTYQLTNVGGQSKAFYIDMAARLGYAISIDEFTEYDVMSDVGSPMFGIAWVFAWRVNAAQTTIRQFNTDSLVDEPLASWGNQILECNINRLKPAHSHVQFAYF